MALIKVESFVYYEHAAAEYVLPHRHETYELVYYISGRGEVNYLGEKHEYCSGTVSVVQPMIKHDEAAAEPTNVDIILFSASAKFNVGNIFLTPEGEAATEVARELNRIREEYEQKRLYSKRIINSLMELILCRLLREYGSAKNKKPSFSRDCADTAKQYIRKHISENIDFQALGQSLGYSYHRFRHIFKEVTGITLSGYLSEQRLNRAKELLETTERTVSDVASETGFSSQQYFINFFRTHVGVSPARYRRIFKTDNPTGVYRFK